MFYFVIFTIYIIDVYTHLYVYYVGAEEGSHFRGGLISQQEKLSMVKIDFYEGLLK